jgi:hypothetical protein
MEKVVIKIDDPLSDQINNSGVGFLKFRDSGREADVAGSGTFVQLGKIKGILTAGHVIDNLPETGQVGLVRPQATFQNLRIEPLDSSTENSRAIMSGPKETSISICARRDASALRSARLMNSPCPAPSIAACGLSTKLVSPSESQ